MVRYGRTGSFLSALIVVPLTCAAAREASPADGTLRNDDLVFSFQRYAAMQSPPIVSICSPYDRGGINNRLLLALPPATLDRMLRISEPVNLIRGQQIDCAGEPIRHIYFINRGLVCIAKTLEDGRTVEIGAIGVEGVANLLPFVGVNRTLLDVIVQIPGTALRMGCDVMKRELENDNAFRQAVEGYVRFSLSELARHIACSRLHHIEERCCRWLLIAHDHAMSDEFPVTHEFLAMMLGYQRAGVSIAMGALVKAGFIEHKRGTVTIINRPGLEAATCDCYREMRNEFDEFLPLDKRHAGRLQRQVSRGAPAPRLVVQARPGQSRRAA